MKYDPRAGLRPTVRIGLKHLRSNFVARIDGISGASGQAHAMEKMKVSPTNAAGKHFQPRPAGRPRLAGHIQQRHMSGRDGDAKIASLDAHEIIVPETTSLSTRDPGRS